MEKLFHVYIKISQTAKTKHYINDNVQNIPWLYIIIIETLVNVDIKTIYP